ncbi:MAG: hypothetical protein H6707_14455 [Deltaproteobacteria bacterium]|nr:hypothetical protein [Deltaproteobacteria bacterium]
MSRRALLLVCCLSTSVTLSCARSSLTGAALELLFDAEVDELHVVVLRDSQALREETTPGNLRLVSPYRVLLAFAEDWDGRQLAVRAEARNNGQSVRSLEQRLTVRARQTVQLRLDLRENPVPADGGMADGSPKTDAGPCPTSCPTSDPRCEGKNAYSICQQDSDGCYRWQAALPCPDTTPLCSQGKCNALCADACTRGSKRCDSSGLAVQSCDQTDSDGCAQLGSAVACGAGQRCRGGQCYTPQPEQWLISTGSQAFPTAIANTPSGTFAITGTFVNKTFELAGKQIDGPSSYHNSAWVAELDAKGNASWLIALNGLGNSAAYGILPLSIVVDAQGAIYIAGYHHTGIALDGKTVFSTPNDVTPQRLFVLKLSASGSLVWATELAAAKDVSQLRLALSSDGAIAVGGSFAESLTIGNDSLRAQKYHDPFVALLSKTGQPRWARAIGTNSISSGNDVLFAPDGSIYLAGEAAAPAPNGPFLAKYDPQGKRQWLIGSSKLASGFHYGFYRLAFDGQHNVVAVGSFAGTFEKDQLALNTQGDEDIAIAAFSPTGKALWGSIFRGVGQEHLLALRALPGGDWLVCGSIGVEAQLGNATLVSRGPAVANQQYAEHFGALVARLNASGGVRWADVGDSDGRDGCADLAVSGKQAVAIGWWATQGSTQGRFGANTLTAEAAGTRGYIWGYGLN